MEFLFWLVAGLAVLAVVGHGIWVLVRATFRGLVALVAGDAERPISARLCPRCGDVWGSPQDFGRCPLCGWSTAGEASADSPRPELARARLRDRIDRYHQLGLISGEFRARLREAFRAGDEPEVGRASAPRPRPVAPRTPPAAPSRLPEPATPAPAPHPASADIPGRARSYQAFLDRREDEAQSPAPEPRTQQVVRWLAAFLEEKSIRWGELVGGLLIVCSSMALVLSFWSSIAERPFLKYGLFLGVTALLFGLGHHADRRWKLPTTALGLLTVAALLTPLNFLAIASLARGPQAESAGTLIGELVALAIFGALVYRAGRLLVAGAPWTLLAGVMVPSAAMLLVRRSVDPGRALAAALPLGAPPCLALGAAIGGWMARHRREPAIGEGAAVELLRLLGLATFAAAVALGLVLAHGGPIGVALHRVSPLAPLAGAAILAPGLLLWRRTEAPELVGYRTTGAAIAAAGALILLAGVALAWPAPARMLPVALLDFAVLTAIALAFRVPAAHALAGGCLALAYLLGWLLAAGRLGWRGVTSAQAEEALLSSGSGAALVPIVLAFGAVAAAGVRRGRRLDAQAYALVAALAGLFSLGTVTWLGFGRAGDPAGATWVYLIYAAAATAAGLWFARYPLVEGTSGQADLRVLGWLGSGLLLAALVQGLAFGGLPFRLGLPWVAALLAHATIAAAGSLLLAGRRGVPSSEGTPGEVLAILDRSALAASIAAACGLAIAAPEASASALAPMGFWLAAAWMAVAWCRSSPAWFGAGQAAFTGAVLCAVAARLGRQGWYARSPLSWLDPWTIQAQGLALGLIGLGWIGVRLAVRAGSITRLKLLLDPPWPAVDRYARWAVVVLAVALTSYAVVPGAAQELTPRNLAVELGGLAAAGRVVPPIGAFEVPRVPHAHAIGAGSWALLGMAVALMLAGQWERTRRADLLAALGVATMAAPLAAAQAEAGVAVASALRWWGALALLAASCLIWNRTTLARWGRSLGWRFEPDQVGGLHRPAIGTVLGLGMLPMVAMGLYVGAAALTGRPLDEGQAWSWAAAGGLFLAMGAASFGLRQFGKDRQIWARPAGALLAVMGALPMVAVTVFVVAAALKGNPIVGPEPGSFFGRIGQAGSYVPPILLLAATLVGFAIRERSSGSAFAAGLTLNLAATVALLMAGASAGWTFDARLWVLLAQLNAVVAAITALAWIGTLVGWRRRLGEPGPVPAEGLLGTSVALGVALNLIVLIGGALTLFVDPVPPKALQAIAGPLGFVALAMAAGAVVAWSRSRGRPIAPDWPGIAVLCLAVLLGLTLTSRDTGNWLAYHGMMVGLALAGGMLPLFAWQDAGLRLAAVADEARSAAGRWSTVALGLVALFAIRGYGSDPQSPWWTVGGLATMAGLAAVLACWSARPGYVRLAAGLLNLAMTFGWCTWALWAGTPRGWPSMVDLLNVNVVALALPAPLWLRIGRRFLPWEGWPAPFHRVASWGALGTLMFVVAAALADDALGGTDRPGGLIGWAAVAATAVALGTGLCAGGARAPIAGLYLLGLGAAGWGVAQLHLPPHRLAWTGSMTLAAYSVGTSYLWSRRAALRDVADRLGIPRPDPGDPEADLSWLVPANLALAAGVLALAIGTILTEPEVALRSASAHAALAQGLAIGLLARGARRSRLQAVALAVGVAGAAAWGWAWIAPGTPTAWPDRAAVALAALVGGFTLYGLGLTKLAKRVGDWTLAARRLVPYLLGLAGAVLAVILGVELYQRSEGLAIPMAAPAVATVALALAAAAAAALIAAVVPGRDPLGLSDRGRTAYVYGAEALIAILGLQLRLAMPWLFSGMFARYWSLILLGVAFAGVGLGELFRRQGRLVLAEPLERTGALLPVFPLLAAYWIAQRPGEDVVFLVLVGALYATLSSLRSSPGFGALAALAGNAAIWSWLGHRDGVGLLAHPQLWVIPPALCLLAGAHLNRDRLTAAQSAAIRHVAALAIYLASTADILLVGVAQAPWLPAVLAALSVAGIGAGIVLRVRGFLFLGLGFLSLALFSIIWFAAVDLRQTWLWAASGVAAGVAILAAFALVEKKRLEVLRVVGQIREWNA